MHTLAHPNPRRYPFEPMAYRIRNPAARLRSTVDALPRRTRIAMLRGIEQNRIVVGAYADPRSGGICPMLAAHRSGGRTSVASFARAWDAFTGAKRPRLATRREIRALRTYLEMSLLREDDDGTPITELAAEIRAERASLPQPPPLPEPEAGEIRIRRRKRGTDLFAAAEAELSAELLGAPAAHRR
jgi:hypothetical protein